MNLLCDENKKNLISSDENKSLCKIKKTLQKLHNSHKISNDDQYLHYDWQLFGGLMDRTGSQLDRTGSPGVQWRRRHGGSGAIWNYAPAPVSHWAEEQDRRQRGAQRLPT